MKKKVLYGVTLALLGGASMVSLQSCKDDLSDLENKVDFNDKQNWQSLQELWDYCRDSGDKSLNGRINAINKFIDELNALDEDETDPEKKSFINAFKALRQQVKDLQEQVDKLPLDELDNRITALESTITAMVNRFDNMITNLIIQRAFGPAFGDFSLPMGVQSNMLFNWYGKQVTSLDKFPTTDVEGLVGIDLPFQADLTAENGGQLDLKNVDVYNDVDLGEIYLTVNPIGHKFDKTVLTLENSQGHKFGGDTNPYKLVLEANPDYLLTFGSTRASEPVTKNGLYKAAVKLTRDKLEGVEGVDVSLSEDALKSAAKNAVKNPSLGTAANLVKVVYDQITAHQIPAYALRYDWSAPTGQDGYVTPDVNWTYGPVPDPDDPDNPEKAENKYTSEDNSTEATPTTGKYSVLSKYEIAVVTARPLSFNALKKDGAWTDKKLPTGNLANFFERLKNKVDSKFNINTDIVVDGHKVEIGEIEFKNENNDIFAYVKGMIVDGKAIEQKAATGRSDTFETGAWASVNSDGVLVVYCGDKANTAVASVNEAIAWVLSVVTDNYNNEAFKAEAQLKLDAVLVEMNKQINSIIDDIKLSVDNAFSSITGSNYFELANRAFNLYNRFANKVNEFLADPNAALQVAALYNTADDLGFLSQRANDATQFDGNGDFQIYLTTYTGEIVAPAFKKYFACISAPANADLTKINSGDLAKVLDGSTKAVTVSGVSEKGVYEFVYQALDYSGYTSTKKFYIEVK